MIAQIAPRVNKAGWLREYTLDLGHLHIVPFAVSPRRDTLTTHGGWYLVIRLRWYLELTGLSWVTVWVIRKMTAIAFLEKYVQTHRASHYPK